MTNPYTPLSNDEDLRQGLAPTEIAVDEVAAIRETAGICERLGVSSEREE